jgi:hypothetical protein
MTTMTTETEMTMTIQQQVAKMFADDPASAVCALMASIEDGQLDGELKLIGETIVARSKVLTRQRDREKTPTHKIVGDVRPRYLQGATGRAGAWVSESRREFFPTPGTEAYARGRRWKITGQNVVALEMAG